MQTSNNHKIRTIALYVCLFDFILSVSCFKRPTEPPQQSEKYLNRIDPLYSIHFVNEKTGWVVGEEGLISKTTDGGTTWVNQNSGTEAQLKSVFFIDENNGWAVGQHYSDKAIYKTTDGGINWRELSTGLFSWLDLRSVYFTNESTGWIAGNNGIIINTTDQGLTWSTQINMPDCVVFEDIFFIDINTGWAVGHYWDYERRGIILKTTDGSNSWITLKE